MCYCAMHYIKKSGYYIRVIKEPMPSFVKLCCLPPLAFSNSLQFLSHFYALEGEIFMGFLDPKMQLEVGGVVYENWGFLLRLFI